MIRKAYALICLPLGFLVGCGGSSSSPSASGGPVQVVGITANNSSPQSAPSGKPFPSSLSVTVTTSGVRTGGERVTFTAPASGPSGTFANGTSTESDITDSDGVATSSPFTANEVGGNYMVMAGVQGAPSPVSFKLTNIAVTSYSFYMSGQDASFNFYALAGSVAIDPTGNVIAGEQDYNDGGAGFASPEPAGDTITGGTLTFPSGSPSGQGTLTLKTNNTTLGVNADGTEVFGVQFVNPNHALIVQFDGFATSSGSMDVQTLPSTLNGAYAFALSGLDSSFTPVSFGGVLSVNGTSISNGIVDINDAEDLGLTTGTAFSGKISAPDAFGRGTIKGLRVAGAPVLLNYYVVGPKAIRLIDVDASDSAVGSAFSQGTGTFSNASLGPSVFAIAGNQLFQFGGLGQFTTSNTSSSPAGFSGVADESEPVNGVVAPLASKISGTYSIGNNGYGSLTFNTTNPNYPGLGDITSFGIYMTDPTLNLNDPNSKTGGGGALVVDLDGGELTGIPLPGGAGVIIPQTDVATADFAGNYVAGWQNFNNMGCGCEFDMIAQGTMVANGPLSLTGLVSDPFFSNGTADATSSANTFVGAPLADTNHPGRYTMTSGKTAVATVIDGSAGPKFDMVLYQASGTQLFWLDRDASLTTVSLGPLEQQPSGTTPAARNRAGRLQRRGATRP